MIITEFVQTLPYCNDFYLVYVLATEIYGDPYQEIGCLTVSWKLSRILLPYLVGDF